MGARSCWDVQQPPQSLLGAINILALSDSFGSPLVAAGAIPICWLGVWKREGALLLPELLLLLQLCPFPVLSCLQLPQDLPILSSPPAVGLGPVCRTELWLKCVFLLFSSPRVAVLSLQPPSALLQAPCAHLLSWGATQGGSVGSRYLVLCVQRFWGAGDVWRGCGDQSQVRQSDGGRDCWGWEQDLGKAKPKGDYQQPVAAGQRWWSQFLLSCDSHRLGCGGFSLSPMVSPWMR